MADEMKLIAGDGLADDLAAFRPAWKRAERVDVVPPERVLAFASCNRLAPMMAASEAGRVVRSSGVVRAAADRILAEIEL